jgi:hypothetical protein
MEWEAQCESRDHQVEIEAKPEAFAIIARTDLQVFLNCNDHVRSLARLQNEGRCCIAPGASGSESSRHDIVILSIAHPHKSDITGDRFQWLPNDIQGQWACSNL